MPSAAAATKRRQEGQNGRVLRYALRNAAAVRLGVLELWNSLVELAVAIVVPSGCS